jgi:outer membrane protein assembly factor BamB
VDFQDGNQEQNRNKMMMRCLTQLIPLSKKFLGLAGLAVTLVSTNPLAAQTDWNQFRGASGTGLALDVPLSPYLDLQEDVLWKTEIPGIGWSSPVHDQRRVWMTTSIVSLASPEKIQERLEGVQVPEIKTVAERVDLKAVCVDLETGVIIYDLLLASIDQPEIINPLNSYASPTPAISGENVICHFGTYGTWCIDVQTGATLWFRKFEIDHSVGPGSSPVIFENRVLLVCDGMDQQYVVCVDLETGADLWKTNRPPIRSENGELRKSFGTPLIIKIGDQHQAIIPGAQWLVAYDLQTGEELWRVDHGDGYSIAPVPTYEAGLIVFATGYGRPDFMAVDPTGKGDVTETNVRWRIKNAPAMSSFVGHQGKIYAVNDTGMLMCIDAATGDVVQRTRLGGNFSASPILANGHLFFCSREGYLSVVEATPELNLVHRVNFESPVMASPAIFQQDLILRTRAALYRIRGNKAAVPDAD